MGPGATFPFTAPKHFSPPMTVPSTSRLEISGSTPMNDLGKLPQCVHTHLSGSLA
jgi:hypothetical protein